MQRVPFTGQNRERHSKKRLMSDTRQFRHGGSGVLEVVLRRVERLVEGQLIDSLCSIDELPAYDSFEPAPDDF
jgi:hypothetical protein